MKAYVDIEKFTNNITGLALNYQENCLALAGTYDEKNICVSWKENERRNLGLKFFKIKLIYSRKTSRCEYFQVNKIIFKCEF